MNIKISQRPEVTRANDMDGVIEMEDLSGQAQLRNNPIDYDLISPDQGWDWVNANGKKPKKKAKGGGLFSGMKARRQQRQDRRTLRTESKAQARLIKAGAKQTKADAKQTDANAKVESAKALGKADDSTLVAALNNSSSTSAADKSEGMSMGAKIGIGVGIVVVLGIATFVIIKMRKKK